MKKINIENGVVASLPTLINKTQEVFEENLREITGALFTPGLFIRKNIDGSFADDFKPSIVAAGPSTHRLKIQPRSSTLPAVAYTTGGKLITLNEEVLLDPPETSGYIEQEDPATFQTYILYAVPSEEEQFEVDYLPNHQILGETKKLIKVYLVDFILIKKTGNTIGERETISGQAKAISLEGIKICEFDVNGNHQIQNLVDYRWANRAYINNALYDFFNEAFLKHNFTLAICEDSANDGQITFGDSPNFTLTGKFTLLGVKKSIPKVIAHAESVTVSSTVFTTVDVPIGNLIYILLSEVEWSSNDILHKQILTEPIDTFIPTVNKIVLGYHLKVQDTGNPSEE